MKNEEFDDAIRKKLESLNQTYTESDIDKVHHQVMKLSRFPWKGSTGSWLLYSLSAAAFTTALIWSVSQFRSNKTVSFSADTLTKQSVIPATEILKNTKDTFNLPAISPNPVSPAPENKQSGSIEKNTHSTPVSNPNSKALTQTKTVTQNQLPRLAATTTSNAAVDKTPVAETIKTNSPATDSTIVKSAIQTTSQLTVNSVKPSPETVTVEAEIASPDKNNRVQIIPASEVEPEPNVVNTQSDCTGKITIAPQSPAVSQGEITGKSAVDNKTSPSKGILSADTLPAEKKGKSQENPFSRVKGSSIKVGTDFQLSGQSLTPGINAEFIIADHFGIQTGLKYRIYRDEHFTDKADFFGHKPHDFNHRIEDHFAGQDHVRDVTISNRILQVPLFFNYRLPLKRNYNLSFSLGTDLDVYLRQKLYYTIAPDTGGMHQDNFQAKGNVSLVNTFTFSAGVGKQWKSWLLEVQPYISPRFTEVFYKPKEIEFGVEIGIKYCFGK